MMQVCFRSRGTCCVTVFPNRGGVCKLLHPERLCGWDGPDTSKSDCLGRCILRGLNLHKCPDWVRPGITISDHNDSTETWTIVNKDDVQVGSGLHTDAYNEGEERCTGPLVAAMYKE
ncbi:hypothetical protein M758_11G084100 [Ceratodon purpureus]|nr:hypothetical protein M758_11G084100 [Ceratodon purpureus]